MSRGGNGTCGPGMHSESKRLVRWKFPLPFSGEKIELSDRHAVLLKSTGNMQSEQVSGCCAVSGTGLAKGFSGMCLFCSCEGLLKHLAVHGIECYAETTKPLFFFSLFLLLFSDNSESGWRGR